MPESINDAQEIPQEDPLKKVWPTLFVAVGGTGMEISLRLRRRIINAIWGDSDNPMRIASLSDFPVAQFINFDLNAGSVTESGKSATTDPLAELVKFSDGEKLILKLDMDKYISTDGQLNKYPLIASWFPLTRKKTLELGIDPSKGAGQIRSLSRLYFFDKYDALKERMGDKIKGLLQGVSSQDKTHKLGLELEGDSLRVVVIASTAGGTGSGAFLDMGYLAKVLSKIELPNGTRKVDLCLMLPSGYSGHGKKRTQANTYAALMELESCIGNGLAYVKGWDDNEEFELPDKPYDDVFLFDTGNLALKKTANANDLFDMVADILFEDFTSQDFANWKRSTSVNQNQYKIDSFSPPLDTKKYGSMRMMFSKAYSAFGQSIIDTQLEQRIDVIACNQVNDMLKVFFGIASDSGTGREVPPPTPDDARSLLRDKPVYCHKENFKLAYHFVVDAAPYVEGLEFGTHVLIDKLLYDGDKPLLGQIKDRIDKGVSEILLSSEKDQRLPRVDELRLLIDRDLGIEGGVTDAGARGLEESIKARRESVFKDIVNENSDLVRALWNAVDNKESGGLDYTIKLIERLKDCIENGATGLIHDMEIAQTWFAGLWEKIRTDEIKVIRDHINQAKGGGLFSFVGNKEAHAEAKLQQMGEAIRWYAEARLREIASRESVELLKDLSNWFGQHKGLDERTNRKRWSADSFAGKLAGYEKLVVDIMSSMNEEVIRTQEATKKGHAAYQVVKASMAELDAARNLNPITAMEWAKQVFGNLGGSRKIFVQLEGDATRAKLIGDLRNLALNGLPSLGKDEDNPLYKALLGMKENNLTEYQQLIKKCMDMAMPWVEANIGGSWKVQPDQYTCIIGVNGPELFDRAFKDDFKRAIPPSSMMPEGKIKFYETGVAGKLTCYIELSGVPLPALNQISVWRDSYNEEGKKIPVHNHKDKTLFVHPIEPSPVALDRLADHFKLYLQGIILGVLKLREEDPEERVYCLKIEGEELSVGNERTIRMEGIATEHLVHLQKKVSDVLDKIKTPLQYAGFVVIYDYYSKWVYPKATIKYENMREFTVDGFCHVMCNNLRNEADKIMNKKISVTDIDSTDLISKLMGNEKFVGISKWTHEVEGSETDVYEKEVGKSHRAKRILQPKYSETGWLEKHFPSDSDEDKPSNTCPQCHGQIDGNPKFCPHCGGQMKSGNKCSGCGCAIEGNPKFCPECGAKQGVGLKCGSCGCSIEGCPKFCPECGKAV